MAKKNRTSKKEVDFSGLGLENLTFEEAIEQIAKSKSDKPRKKQAPKKSKDSNA